MSVLEKYRRLFRPDEAEAERSKQSTEDLRRFVTTKTFAELRRRIRDRSMQKGWESGMTQEQAAANLIAQTIYGEILRDLDSMADMAAETLDGQE